jgi:hypothetical protein
MSAHVTEFKANRENKNLTAKQIKETHSQLKKIVALANGCGSGTSPPTA